MVLVSKKERYAVYKYLLLEGLIVVKKDNNLSAHTHVNLSEGTPIPNLHVMMLMKSLKSRDYVSEVFSWQWSYYTLTDKGAKYIRDCLHIPSTVVPLTHKKNKKLQGDRPQKKQQYEKGDYSAPATTQGETPGAQTAGEEGQDVQATATGQEEGATRGVMGRGKRFD